MKKQFLWLSAFIFSMSLWPTNAVVAASTDKKPCHCHDQSKPSNKLNLSHDQKTKIKSIRASNRQLQQTNRKQLFAIKQEMNQLITSEKMDDKKLDALISQRNKIIGTMVKNRIMMKNQIYNVLSESQKLQYKNNLQKNKAHKA